jgi:biotin synthase
MIGMGPFIAHPETVLGKDITRFLAPNDQVPNNDIMTYKTVALLRLISPYTNIPSTTALATFDPASGMRLALERGANVVMPNCTPAVYKQLYDIYPNPKRRIKELNQDSMTVNNTYNSITDIAGQIGRTIGVDSGLSLNWLRRQNGLQRHGVIPLWKYQ